MTASTDIDRILAAWFDDTAPEAAPSDLVPAIAAAAAHVSRRPRWLVLDRWRVSAVGPAIPLRALVAVAIALLLAIAGLFVLGSRHPVPPPFGPARPGVFALSVGGDIVSMAPDGTGVHALTSGTDWDVNPVFSRDGTEIAFWSHSPTSLFSDIVVMQADGSGRRTVASAPYTNGGVGRYGNAVSWSPDGRSIAYWVDPGNQPQIYVAQADGSGSRPVGDPALKGFIPAWSPDGTEIAFSGGANDANRGLYVMRADGSGAHQLSHVWGIKGSFGPVWSPDGRRLMFAAGNGMESIWMIDSDGSNEHLVDEGDYVGAPSWSPDGTQTAWLGASADASLPAVHAVADAVGSNIQRFPHDGVPYGGGNNFDGYVPCVGWSADGKRVIGVLTALDGNADRLIEIDPATGDSTVISTPGLRAWNQQRLAP